MDPPARQPRLAGSSPAQPAAQPSAANAAGEPQTIGQRYRVMELLGRGGMGSVYRVEDPLSAREVALKLLLAEAHDSHRALFQREFHTLAQLAHPRVIEVYDYAVDPQLGAYYTMELLDGGDLKQRSPLPWREACELMFDVASSLALLHARRLLHRDVSPRNVRCTLDGHAKLIDFGAMTPMGFNRQIAGTPGFMAPEALSRLTLDARTDLYSFGATLYYALTGKLPYAAAPLSQLQKTWQERARPASHFVPDIPPALDALITALLSVEPAGRPRNAHEVMQRLSTCAGVVRDEPLAVAQAYLVTPTLVGRDTELATARDAITAAQLGRRSALLVVSEPGLGRSRLLEACALEAKALGVQVLRTGADSTSRAPFAAAQTLCTQLFESQPELGPDHGAVPEGLFVFEAGSPAAIATGERSRPELEIALERFFLAVARQQPLLIAVDDVDRIDEASLALLAALAHAQAARGLALITSADLGQTRSARGAEPPTALGSLAGACEPLELAPLSAADLEQLLASMFDDAPDVQLLALRIHARLGGNPRDAMDVIEQLIARGRIGYARGGWTLPHALSASELPSTGDEAFRRRIAALPELARELLEAQCLASHAAFSVADYAALLERPAPAVLEAALGELIARQMLISDGSLASLARPAALAAHCDALAPERRRRHHLALSRLYGDRAGGVIAARHLLAAEQPERALECLSPLLRAYESEPDAILEQTDLQALELVQIFDAAYDAALRCGRSALEVAELQHWLIMLSTATDDRYFQRVAAQWLAVIERDSGLAALRELGADVEPGQRLMLALTRTGERYNATPPSERVYPIPAAIKFVTHYVVAALANATRSQDAALLRSLPALIEPFAPLTPLVHAIWQNALASIDVTCDGLLEQGRQRWLKVYERLSEPADAQSQQLIARIQSVVAYALGALEIRMSLDSGERWAALLDRDPLQAVNAMALRKLLRLAHGDVEGAEFCRRRAELLAIQTSSRLTMPTTLALELGLQVLARDLTGVKRVKERIAPLAARYPGWQVNLRLAEAQFELLCDDPSAARASFERCLELAQPDPGDSTRSTLLWPSALSGYIDTLLALGEVTAACDFGRAQLERCHALGIGCGAHMVVRSLAMAEAKAGRLPAAVALLEGMIAEQLALGVSGLALGFAYEDRVRIAIQAGDRAAVEHNLPLAAAAYRHGTGSALATRYAQLLDRARSFAGGPLPEPSDFRSTQHETTAAESTSFQSALVDREMRAASSPEARASCAIRLLCLAEQASGGWLYLCHGEDLRAVTGHGVLADTAELRASARQFLDHMRTEADLATALGPASGEPAVETVAQTRAAGPVAATGKALRFHLLDCIRDGTSRIIGVAALSGSRPQLHAAAQLKAEIARHLLQDTELAERSY